MGWLALYAGALLLITAWYMARRAQARRRHAAELRQAEAAGMVEPPSLHPVVDPTRCIGSGSCARACPEKALGLVDGKATLVNPSACIGHGACFASCPLEAITLVFGTARRGVDIPEVTPEFESNVPGIFIAGELGGMGLIRKAAEQGRQAVQAIRKRPRGDHDLDLLIVGAGPAGLSAGLAALEQGLRYRIVEQEDSLGGSIFHYPRHKVAMTAPVKLAVVGTMRFDTVPKETLLAYWEDVVTRTGLAIGFRECLVDIGRDGDGFAVQTSGARYRARSVLLAIGRRGTPRKLGVPGEEASKVVYRLVDAAQYEGQAVLVVGGGDVAVEAVLALAAVAGARVTLSYRGEAFTRLKAANRSALDAACAAGTVQVLTGTVVERIEPDRVQLRGAGEVHTLANDAVIVCAGGELPTQLLQKVGIRFATKYGTA